MIVITTPTGQIGRQVLDNVLDSGEPIRVIARDPSRLPSRARGRVEVVRGSMDDLNVVNEAFTGADSVFWLTPPNPQAESIESHYLGFTQTACKAIGSQGVKRVIGITSLGRGLSKNAGQISASLDADELIERTGVSFRAVSMPFLMENLLGQVESIKDQRMFFMPNSADLGFATVATGDAAAVAAELLLDDSWSGQEVVPVLGPDDLSPNEMAKIMSEALDRPVHYQRVSGEVYKATLMQYGMSEDWAQGLVDMAAAMDGGVYDAGQRTAESAGRTSFRQWCEKALKPAVLA